MENRKVPFSGQELKKRFLDRPISSLVAVKVKVNQSHYRPEVPRGFQVVKVPRLRDDDPGKL